MLYGITLIILGLLAAPSLVLMKKPNSKELFDKVAPYQGWFGLIFAVIGVIGIIECVLNIDMLVSSPFQWIVWVLVTVVEAALGFILGYGLIRKYALSKNDKAGEKGEKLLRTLLPFQGTLGIVAVVLGILQVISSIF